MKCRGFLVTSVKAISEIVVGSQRHGTDSSQEIWLVRRERNGGVTEVWGGRRGLGTPLQIKNC